MSNETEALIRISQQRKPQGQLDSLLNSTKPVKKNTNAPQIIP
jgi:hypothetical protein